MPWLINAAQLDKFRKNQKALIILDASWHMPNDARDARQEFIEKHIIGAHFFDINQLHDHNPENAHPHFLLHDEKLIGEKLGDLGIRNDYKIILYDNSNLHTACRALWMLKVCGHNPQLLYILDGGLNAWEKNGGKIESGMPTTSPKPYTATLQPQWTRSLSQIKTNLHNPSEQVIDVRHAIRFAGGKESRPNLRSGHIPGSFSFPYITMFDTEGCWKPLEKIRYQLNGIGVDSNSPIISTCGSSITAAILDFTLDVMGHTNHAIYQGSWAEWGNEQLYANELSLNERPVITCLD